MRGTSPAWSIGARGRSGTSAGRRGTSTRSAGSCGWRRCRPSAGARSRRSPQVGTRSPATREGLEALTRYLVRPPVPSPPRPLARALRRAGTVLVSLANGSLADWRLGPVQLNPLRWLESRLGRAAGLDPAVPHEQLALVSGLSWGPFEFQVRAFDRLAALGAANRERARRPRSPGPPIASDTPDGDTFTCWAPAVPFPRFPAEVAVDTGWTRFGPGRLVPLYVTRSRIALESLLRRGDQVDRSPIPYHFVQQVTGRIDVPSCPGRKASGLIAGQFHDNATWAEDRALATDMFGFPVIEGFRPRRGGGPRRGVRRRRRGARPRSGRGRRPRRPALRSGPHHDHPRGVRQRGPRRDARPRPGPLGAGGRLLAYAHDFVMGRHVDPGGLRGRSAQGARGRPSPRRPPPGARP